MLYHFFKRKKQIVLLAFALALLACEDEYVCPVPNVERFEFSITMPVANIMTSVAKAGYGYNKHGVIVFRYNNTDKEVFAFDATCPDSEECIASGVVKDDEFGHAVCKRCGSRYSLVDGKHSSKKIALRPYYVQKVATEYYRVSNY